MIAQISNHHVLIWFSKNNFRDQQPMLTLLRENNSDALKLSNIRHVQCKHGVFKNPNLLVRFFARGRCSGSFYQSATHLDFGSNCSVVRMFWVARYNDHVLCELLRIAPDSEMVFGFWGEFRPVHASSAQTHFGSVGCTVLDVSVSIEADGAFEHEHSIRVKKRVLNCGLFTLKKKLARKSKFLN